MQSGFYLHVTVTLVCQKMDKIHILSPAPQVFQSPSDVTKTQVIIFQLHNVESATVGGSERVTCSIWTDSSRKIYRLCRFLCNQFQHFFGERVSCSLKPKIKTNVHRWNESEVDSSILPCPLRCCFNQNGTRVALWWRWATTAPPLHPRTRGPQTSAPPAGAAARGRPQGPWSLQEVISTGGSVKTWSWKNLQQGKTGQTHEVGFQVLWSKCKAKSVKCVSPDQ